MLFVWNFVGHLSLNVTRCFVDRSVQAALGHSPQIWPQNCCFLCNICCGWKTVYNVFTSIIPHRDVKANTLLANGV